MISTGEVDCSSAWKFLRVSKGEEGASPRFLFFLEADWAIWLLGGGGRLTCLAARVSPSPGSQGGGASGLSRSLSAPARERSRSRASGCSMSPRKAVVAALGALCLVAVVGLVLLCAPTKDLRDPPAFKYGIVLDAGSSHTAMFVYKWPSDKENETGIVSQHSECHVKGDGISKYSTNPPAAGESLIACLDQALEDVPKARHAITPLYLGATAGMRLLNISDPQASDSVLEAVTSTLKKYPFDFRGARILSGEDEGLFGWVTANYLLENFVKYGWVGRWVRPKKNTVGAMDLGGASTQITFETTGAGESPSHEVTLKLYGQHYKVYTHSYLCYGMNEIFNKLISKVLKAKTYTLELDNPCWPTGFRRSFLMDSIYESPCVSTEKPPNYFPTARVNMSGSGDPAECMKHTESLFRFTGCTYSRCSFDGVFQPPVEGSFIAFSAFFHTVDFLRSVMKRQVATPNDLRDGAEAVCRTPWSELLTKAPALEPYLQNYCSMATFVSLLLTRGYSFSNTTFPNISFQKKAGDTTIGWALGYMLNLTNMIPAEEVGFRKGTSFGPWVGLIFLFVAILLGSLVSLFCLLKSSKGHGGV